MGEKIIGLVLLFSCFVIQHSALGAKSPVNLHVISQHNKWEVGSGVMTSFIITVTDSNNLPIKNVKIFYEIGPEMMQPYTRDSAVVLNGKFTTNSYTLYRPGFLRCNVTANVNKVTYRKLHTIGYDAAKILPTVENPEDFDAFWNKAKSDLAKIPIDAKTELLPHKSTATVNAYQVSFRNINGSRVYGMLAVPKTGNNLPAVLLVPGAGVRNYNPDISLAEKGVIVLTIGIHGIPVNLDSAVYQNLASGALNQYFYFNLQDRDKNYYKRVYLGCIRAIDYLFTRDEFNKKQLAVTGSSQGGALSIVTAALDDRVNYLAAFHPALSDLTGYIYGRAGGWPHVFANDNFNAYYSKENVENLAYYDIVNFAKRIKVPGYYSWGFNDVVCPPTSMYAAYNVIIAPKKLSLFYDLGHWVSPPQKTESVQWILTQVK